MNILPKKKWHVRTKENMARVRKDEAKAAAEEKAILERQILAENERRLEALRRQADDRMDKMFGVRSEEKGKKGKKQEEKNTAAIDETGHVNFFQDLEREERKNLGTGNEDYAKEKEKEKREWESKMGIQVYLGEGLNEQSKNKEWYEKLPMRKPEDVKATRWTLENSGLKKEGVEKPKHRVEFPSEQKDEDSSSSSSDEEEKRERKREKEKEKERRKRRDGSDDSGRHKKKRKKEKRKKEKKKSERESKKSRKRKREEEDEKEEEEYEKDKQRRLALLRSDRLRREREEAGKQWEMLHPEEAKRLKAETAPPPPKYNSQFMPHIARR